MQEGKTAKSLNRKKNKQSKKKKKKRSESADVIQFLNRYASVTKLLPVK